MIMCAVHSVELRSLWQMQLKTPGPPGKKLIICNDISWAEWCPPLTILMDFIKEGDNLSVCVLIKFELLFAEHNVPEHSLKDHRFQASGTAEGAFHHKSTNSAPRKIDSLHPQPPPPSSVIVNIRDGNLLARIPALVTCPRTCLLNSGTARTSLPLLCFHAPIIRHLFATCSHEIDRIYMTNSKLSRSVSRSLARTCTRRSHSSANSLSCAICSFTDRANIEGAAVLTPLFVRISN